MSINAFKDYLIQISQYPLLKPEEEIELGRRIKENGDAAAREKLICCNLRLVVCLAKKYATMSKIKIDELVSEGNGGLISAVDKYDYTYGYRFSTCATPWIKQAMMKCINNTSRNIRLPIHIQQQLISMNRFISTYQNEKNEMPNDKQIAQYLKITLDRLEELRQWKQDTVSSDRVIDSEGKNTVGDLVPDTQYLSPVEYADKEMTKELIQKKIQELPERTQKIIKMRYGLGTVNDPEDWYEEHTLDEVGAAVNLTRERVRQIEKATLQKWSVDLQGAF